MDNDTKIKVEYIKTKLIPTILRENPIFLNDKLLDLIVIPATGLDGFMSSIFKIILKTQPSSLVNDADQKPIEKSYFMIIKLMKGDDSFRKSSKSYTQFQNEVYVYKDVMKLNKKLIKSTTIQLNQLIPEVYYDYYGRIPELNGESSEQCESILVLENLEPKGYRGGPRLMLDEPHLYLMIKLIGKYHALSYANKIRNKTEFNGLVKGLIPFPFLPENGQVNAYSILHKVGVVRFKEYIDRIMANTGGQNLSDTFKKDFANFRTSIGDEPVIRLESFLEQTEPFSVILHGDYNRNNVLFQYETTEGFDQPKDIKMIDFQEVRYGSPAIDLSFFMYMNMDPNYRNDTPAAWDNLLKYYNSVVMDTMVEILECTKDDDVLKPYSYEHFIEHFSKFAFYGVMVCIHFIPWMICSTEECDKLSRLFDTDMHSREFWEFSLVCGGDQANERIFDIVQHASSKGYLNILK